MKKYSKKIALILALTLVLAMAVPAFAVQTNISGSYTATGAQVINVVVSGGSTVKAFLNPKGFAADIYENGSDTKTIGQLQPSGDITTMPIVGVNLGGSPVAVRAAVTSTLTGKFKFASSAPSQKSTSGLVFLEAIALDPSVKAEYELGYDTKATGSGRYDAFNGEAVLNVLNKWKLSWIDNEIFDSKSQEKKDFGKLFGALKKTNKKVTNFDRTNPAYEDEIVVLKKGTAESKQQVCTLPSAEKGPTYFVARLSGRLGEGDTSKLEKMWNSNDGFGATIIWTFQTRDPEVQPKPAPDEDKDK